MVGPIYVLGSGKVGSALARGWRNAGIEVTLRSARRRLPRSIDAFLVVLAVRDVELGVLARTLSLGHARAVVVHCAGALGPEPLEPLRTERVAIGRMHPLLSFADKRHPPPLEGGFMHLSGDRRAIKAGAQAARALGMHPVDVPLDPVRYHAAAAMLANGAAALAGVAVTVQEASHREPDRALAARMLAPLLTSVAHNLARLGVPEVLTGPIRRGDAEGVRRHLKALANLPEAAELYRALVPPQLSMARALAEAEAEKFEEIARVAAIDERQDRSRR